jgi:hypothetical protein
MKKKNGQNLMGKNCPKLQGKNKNKKSIAPQGTPQNTKRYLIKKTHHANYIKKHIFHSHNMFQKKNLNF